MYVIECKFGKWVIGGNILAYRDLKTQITHLKFSQKRTIKIKGIKMFSELLDEVILIHLAVPGAPDCCSCLSFHVQRTRTRTPLGGLPFKASHTSPPISALLPSQWSQGNELRNTYYLFSPPAFLFLASKPLLPPDLPSTGSWWAYPACYHRNNQLSLVLIVCFGAAETHIAPFSRILQSSENSETLSK